MNYGNTATTNEMNMTEEDAVLIAVTAINRIKENRLDDEPGLIKLNDRSGKGAVHYPLYVDDDFVDQLNRRGPLILCTEGGHKNWILQRVYNLVHDIGDIAVSQFRGHMPQYRIVHIYGDVDGFHDRVRHNDWMTLEKFVFRHFSDAGVQPHQFPKIDDGADTWKWLSDLFRPWTDRGRKDDDIARIDRDIDAIWKETMGTKPRNKDKN